MSKNVATYVHICIPTYVTLQVTLYTSNIVTLGISRVVDFTNFTFCSDIILHINSNILQLYCYDYHHIICKHITNNSLMFHSDVFHI